MKRIKDFVNQRFNSVVAQLEAVVLRDTVAVNTHVPYFDFSKLDPPLSNSTEIKIVNYDSDIVVYPTTIQSGQKITLQFNTQVISEVKVSVYNLSGIKHKELIQNAIAGYNEILFETKGMCAGAYVLQLRQQNSITTRKFLVTK